MYVKEHLDLSWSFQLEILIAIRDGTIFNNMVNHDEKCSNESSLSFYILLIYASSLFCSVKNMDYCKMVTTVRRQRKIDLVA